MEDVTELSFVINSAQYDNYKRIIIKSGEDIIGSTVADADNYEFTIGIDNASIDGDITVEVIPLGGIIYFSNNSSNDSDDYTATFYDSDDNVLATRVGTDSIYVDDFNLSDITKIVCTRAEGDYEGIRVMIWAGNADDVVVEEEIDDATNTVTYTGDFDTCKYIDLEYQDW